MLGPLGSMALSGENLAVSDLNHFFGSFVDELLRKAAEQHEGAASTRARSRHCCTFRTKLLHGVASTVSSF